MRPTWCKTPEEDGRSEEGKVEVVGDEVAGEAGEAGEEVVAGSEVVRWSPPEKEAPTAREVEAPATREVEAGTLDFTQIRCRGRATRP